MREYTPDRTKHLYPIEPVPDTRPGVLTLLGKLILRAIGLSAFAIPLAVMFRIGG